MKIFYKILDRLLSSLAMSFVLFMVSFSFMTGKFPPRKDDLKKVVTLIFSMYKLSPQVRDAQDKFQESIDAAGFPNLQQMLEFQRLNLKRTEIALELSSVLPRLQNGASKPEIVMALQRIDKNVQEAEKDLNYVNAYYSDQKGLVSPNPTEPSN